MQNDTSAATELDVELKAAEKLAETGTLDLMPLIQMADRLGTAGRVSEVINLYRCWLSNTKSPIAHIARFNLAVALSAVERLPEAEEVYRKAIYERPDFAQCWFNLGAVIERQMRPEQALARRPAALRPISARPISVRRKCACPWSCWAAWGHRGSASCSS